MRRRRTTPLFSRRRGPDGEHTFGDALPHAPGEFPLAVLAVMVHAMNCYLTHEYAFTALIVPEFKTFWFAPSAGGLSLYALYVMSSGLMLVYVLVDLCAGRPLSMPILRLVPYTSALLLLLALLAYHWELAGVRHLR